MDEYRGLCAASKLSQLFLCENQCFRMFEQFYCCVFNFERKLLRWRKKQILRRSWKCEETFLLCQADLRWDFLLIMFNFHHEWVVERLAYSSLASDRPSNSVALAIVLEFKLGWHRFVKFEFSIICKRSDHFETKFRYIDFTYRHMSCCCYEKDICSFVDDLPSTQAH